MSNPTKTEKDGCTYRRTRTKGEKNRERERQIDRQTETDRQTDRPADGNREVTIALLIGSF